MGHGSMTLSIAVMQPYFFPYAGYFRLFRAADIFVVYDCVQFPRRGYVHRNRFRTLDGGLDWLTLPLEKAPRDTLIKDLSFASQARNEFLSRARKFPDLFNFLSGSPDDAALIPLQASLLNFDRPVVDYLLDTLTATVAFTGCVARFERSSNLSLGPGLRGQERIIEIVRQLGGTRYVNSPGGRDLYDEASFRRAGISLEFLPDFEGSTDSALQLLISSGSRALQDAVYRL